MGILEQWNDRRPETISGQQLVRLARGEVVAELGNLATAFLKAEVWVELDDKGQQILTHQHNDGHRWAHAYSSYNAIPGVKDGWEIETSVIKGAVLRDRLPAGTGIVLDKGTDHERDVIAPRAVAATEDDGEQDER
ncbi:hypothetical protein D5S17_28960 [Pseudonocardiaceae bacterium YIM PH 21723]|nr:hypothetical protein D5S17_28960 [Pseudonocardiaceae bacterium YIM PH 21723]